MCLELIASMWLRSETFTHEPEILVFNKGPPAVCPWYGTRESYTVFEIQNSPAKNEGWHSKIDLTSAALVSLFTLSPPLRPPPPSTFSAGPTAQGDRENL